MTGDTERERESAVIWRGCSDRMGVVVGLGR